MESLTNAEALAKVLEKLGHMDEELGRIHDHLHSLQKSHREHLQKRPPLHVTEDGAHYYDTPRSPSEIARIEEEAAGG